MQKLHTASRQVRRAIALATLPIAGVLAASRAVAAPVVTVPDGCGSTASLETELRRRVGARADAILDETRLSISSDGEQYRLSLRVLAETRELRDPDCRHLFDAAVVIAASLAEGPTPRAQENPPPSPAPRRRPPAGEPERHQEDAPVERERSSAHAPVIGVAAAVGTNFGFLPNPSVGVEFAGSVEWHPWGIALRTRYLSLASERDGTVPPHGVDVQAAGAELAATFIAWQLLEFRAGMNVRVAFGTGRGSPDTSTDTAWSFAPVVGVWAFPLQFGDTWVGAGADLAYDLAPPRFEILQYAEVFHSGKVDGSVFVGAGHRFR